MIAITFALATESSGVIAKLREIGRDSDLVFGKIDNREVTIVRTGVGAKHCKERIEEVLHKARPRLVISSGFAGSAVENLAVGDLILAENFSDQRLLLTAKEILRDSRPQVVRLFTSTSIIGSIEERSVIASKNGAAAVDMETETIAAICKAHGVPLVSARVISDSLSQLFPAPPSVLFDLERQRTDIGRLLLYLLRHPASIGGLLGFSRQISHARAVLTEAIVALAREL